jgi:hypothetical protein
LGIIPQPAIPQLLPESRAVNTKELLIVLLSLCAFADYMQGALLFPSLLVSNIVVWELIQWHSGTCRNSINWDLVRNSYSQSLSQTYESKSIEWSPATHVFTTFLVVKPI